MLFEESNNKFSFLNLILNHLGDYILCLTKDFKIIYINHQGNLFLYKGRYHLGENIKESSVDKEVIAVIQRCIDGEEKIENFEIEVEIPEKKYLSVNSFFITRDKTIEYYGFVFKDSKDIRFNKFKEFNERTLNSLVTLSAGLAHEIKNPLQSLSIHMEIIKRKIGKNISFQGMDLSQDIGVIESEILRLNELLENFIGFMRPSKMKKQEKDFVMIIRSVIQLFEPILKKEGIEILFDNKKKILYMMDEHAMKQVFINLIKNAIEAKRENEKLVIEIKIKKMRDSIIIILLDNGIGMTKEELDNILTPFYTTKEKGEGLGMMMTYKIIERHRGYINIDSKKNKYTWVEIVFPNIQNYIEDKANKNKEI